MSAYNEYTESTLTLIAGDQADMLATHSSFAPTLAGGSMIGIENHEGNIEYTYKLGVQA